MPQSESNNFGFMRFVAASFVIVVHALAILETNHGTNPLGQFTSNPLLLSKLRLYFFFFASGYLVLKSAKNSHNWLDFIWKRIIRIYPAYIVHLLIPIFVIGSIFTTLPFREYLASEQVFKFFIRSCLFFTDSYLPALWKSHPNAEVNGSTYSLIYEVVLYLILMALIILKWAKNARVITALFIVHILAYIVFTNSGYIIPESPLYYIPITNMTVSRAIDFGTYFFAGALFLVYKDFIPVSRWLFYRVLIVLTVTSIYSSISQISCYLFLPYFIYYLSRVQSPNWLKNWSRNGDYSLGMFLYGMPISQVIVELMGSSVLSHSWLYVSLAWISSLLAGVLSWHLIEKPASRFKHLFSCKSL